MGLDHLQEEQQATVLKIRKRVIEAIGRNMDLYGVTLSTGHLYGLLFFADKPMTLDDMGREMEMSKTSMSTGVRTLLDLKMVNKVWSKGSRKTYMKWNTTGIRRLRIILRLNGEKPWRVTFRFYANQLKN